MKMVKDGFHSHLTIYPAERNKAANSLRKWINGLRETAQGGPFLLSETWRQRIKQVTATRFVYDKNLHGSGVVAVESLIEISCAMVTTVNHDDLHFKGGHRLLLDYGVSPTDNYSCC